MAQPSVLPEEFAQLWQKDFSASATELRWPQFRIQLAQSLKLHSVNLTDEDDNLLRAILDRQGTGSITAARFCDLLRGFGPLRRAISMMRRVLAEKWFYAYITGDDAVRVLSGQPTGSFLVRFAGGDPSAFGLFFVWTDGKVLPIFVPGVYGEGLKVREPGEERSFETIYDLLDYYRRWLSVPFTASLQRESWFHGAFSKEDAETSLMERLKVGTYLIRYGATSNDFICSYVAPDESIVHTELRITHTGVLSQEQKASVFAMLNETIRSNRHLLRYNFDPEGIPKLRIRPLDGAVLDTIAGPEDPYQPGEAHNRYGSGKSISTYPKNGGGGYNLICDRFTLQVLNLWSILCVADGCNWGLRPREAALKATAGFLQYIKEQQGKMHDLVEVGHSLLRGFSIAHQKIIEGKTEIWDAGTTTLLAGLVLELLDADKQGEYKYAFVCASVGDCKAFLWSPRSKTVVDITARNRGGINPSDPGGRLGPYLDGGSPDVRNLRSFFELCREGDVIIAMSDGVHDNLDPKSLGKEPADFDCPEATWEEMAPAAAERVKQKFQCETLQQVLDKCVTPKQVVETLLTYSHEVTKNGREFMEANPKTKQPSDYKLYPGKMDHATCVAVQVGVRPLDPNPGTVSAPSASVINSTNSAVSVATPNSASAPSSPAPVPAQP